MTTRTIALVLLIFAFPTLAQPTPTPTCCTCCPTPTPAPGVTPTPTATVTPTPTAPPALGCTLTSAPKSFEPNPPGVPRLSTLSSGFSTALALYQQGAGGPHRILMQESFGYSILDISNPTNPTALYYHDTRFPLGGDNSLAGRPVGGYGGDGQNDVSSTGVSPDGQRLAQSLGGPADGWYTIAGVAAVPGFTLWGSFPPNRAPSTLVHQIGGRYIAYTLSTAVDVTMLPSSFVPGNMSAEATGWPDGGQAVLAGNYIVYVAVNGINVVSVGAPGPPGNLGAASFPRTVITTADLSGRTVYAMTAEVDPTNPAKVWVLVELKPVTPEKSASFGLVSVVSGVKTVKPLWRVPWVTGETFTYPTSPALIQAGGNVVALMFGLRRLPTTEVRLYSTTVGAWGTTPGMFVLPSTVWPGNPMRGFSVGTNVYAYLPTGVSAYVIPMTCQP